MPQKTSKDAARKRAARELKKRAKDKERHKKLLKSGVPLSENAVQHQMLSEFGSPANFVKNIHALAEMFKTDADLKALRYPVDKVYANFDLAADRAALADAYEKKDDLPAYDDQYADFWREKRKAMLKEFVTAEFVDTCDKVFKKLIVTKKGFKKEYRAAIAGRLLLQSHVVALTPTDAPLEDNNLWELILLATIKENPRELPPPPAEAAPADEVPAAAAEPAPTPAGDPI